METKMNSNTILKTNRLYMTMIFIVVLVASGASNQKRSKSYKAYLVKGRLHILKVTN
jgi:hypothetical protein